MSLAEQAVAQTRGTGLRQLRFAEIYDTGEDVLADFYVPALSRATSYDRSVGYFSANALSVAAKGVARFIAGGGRMRLLMGVQITEEDAGALIGLTEIPEGLARRMAAGLVAATDVERNRLAVLAWLANQGRLEAKVAVRVDAAGRPVSGSEGYFHEKIGILTDAAGDSVAFQGSNNESAAGWSTNFESFSVYRSWDTSASYCHGWREKFAERWSGHVPGYKVLPLPQAAVDKLLEHLPLLEPEEWFDPEERPTRGHAGSVARFLQIAPRLPNAQMLGEATTGVQPFPHQRLVAERLAGQYPRSWLVADEVGLGKTISAGLALRRLLLSREVERVLILAPANVCLQWQDELFEKFGLWIPRLEGGKVHGAFPGEWTPVPEESNPYVSNPILLVSSHLARMDDQRQMIAQAPALDLLVVDEAHHARRQGYATLEDYRPSRLLRLLDELRERNPPRATWLLTATPMQVHPVELMDLLKQVGLSGALARWTSFERFYAELSKQADKIDWKLLVRALAGTRRPAPDTASEVLLERAGVRLNITGRERLRNFIDSADPSAEAELLDGQGKEELKSWLRHLSPVGQHMTRHNRETLRAYRKAGLLHEPIAERDVQSEPVEFDPTEAELYLELDDLIDRLLEANQSQRNAGFVLTVYRRRLTSSWGAIRRTFEKRLGDESGLGDFEGDLLEDVQIPDNSAVDDRNSVVLSDEDRNAIRGWLKRIDTVPDSKFERLRRDLDDARGAGAAVIIFTQYMDTLTYLRDRLAGVYRSELATFGGNAGRRFDSDSKQWQKISKQQLVDLVRGGQVRILLATDSASEGLNLQTCSRVINFDLPWNPMRVEQRIGRIDRIGQQEPVIKVRNYVIPGTVEQQVYAALAERIDLFSGLVGRLQPILGATEAAFNAIFKAPRSERQAAVRSTVAGLISEVDRLEAKGIDIDLLADDPMPLPRPPEPPVTLKELEALAGLELNLRIGTVERPASFDPRRASRDPQDWQSLITYGHPDLESELVRVMKADPSLRVLESSGMAVAVRADRAPPEVVEGVGQVRGLGAPVALGDAERTAAAALSEALRLRRDRHALNESARAAETVESIRQEFVRIVRGVVGARAALRQLTTLEEGDASKVWSDLVTSSNDGWQYAAAFAKQLGLESASWLPAQADVNRAAQIPVAELQAEAAAAPGKMLQLMKRWKELQSPSEEAVWARR